MKRTYLDNQILEKIEESVQKKVREEGRRKHLGASSIGQECLRRTWYDFRWCKYEDFSGRMLRLFARGHLEELRFIEYLRNIGIYVKETDDQGEQFKISDANGHFGGSCDGFAFFPRDVFALPSDFDYNIPVLTEFKTYSEKSFKELLSKGMPAAKPQHKAQIDTYGYKFGVKFYLYMAVNKNNDDLYIEFGRIDYDNGFAMINRANQLINATEPPPRAFAKTHRECNWCNYNQICHYNETVEKNCRSCKNAKPVENKQWFCLLGNGVIPEHFIEKGCDSWVPCDV